MPKKDSKNSRLHRAGGLQRKLQPVSGQQQAPLNPDAAVTALVKIQEAGELMEEAQAMDDSQPENWSKMEQLLRKAANLVDNEAEFAINEALIKDRECILQSYRDFCTAVAEYYLTDPEIEDPHSAIDYYNKARSIDPDDPETLIDLGTAYTKISDPNKALEHWHQALENLDEKKPADREKIEIILENTRQLKESLGIDDQE